MCLSEPQAPTTGPRPQQGRLNPQHSDAQHHTPQHLREVVVEEDPVGDLLADLEQVPDFRITLVEVFALAWKWSANKTLTGRDV